MPHLTTLGSTIRQDNINRVQSGKVNKGYKNHYSDFVSNFKNVKTGKFVEKGGFTYKHDNNGLIGIDRQKKTEQNIQQNAIGAPQINIHMDWNGLFNQMKDVKQATPVIVTQQPKKDVVTPQQLSRISSFSSNSEVPTDISKLKFAAADLIEFLKSKKSKKTITFT